MRSVRGKVVGKVDLVALSCTSSMARKSPRPLRRRLNQFSLLRNAKKERTVSPRRVGGRRRSGVEDY